MSSLGEGVPGKNTDQEEVLGMFQKQQGGQCAWSLVSEDWSGRGRRQGGDFGFDPE